MSGLVPKLRFPEFKDKWENKTLKNVAKFSKGKGISKSDVIENGMTPCIRYGELYTTYNTKIDDVISFTNIDPSNLILSKGNEVLVPASGEDAKDIATASVVKRSGIALGGDLNIIHSKNDGYFLASYLSGKKRLFLASLAQGNSVVHLYPSQLGSLHIDLPSLPEQQKIADFLSSVDAKIDAVKRKQDAFERYKKGLMQQIFTQKIRFKQDDGSDFPEWEEKRLGDVMQITMGQSPASESYNDFGDGIPLIQGNTDIKARKTSPRRYTTHITNTCKDGDIIMSVRAPIGEVAQALHNACIGRGVASLEALKGQSQSYYYQYLIFIEERWLRIGQGSTFSAISGADIRSINVNTPSLPEQRKIAAFLSSVEAKIDAIKAQAEKLEAFKKGLLQQMFV